MDLRNKKSLVVDPGLSKEFRHIRSLAEYDVTPEWVLHHLIQHEAEHRSQIGGLRVAAERDLALG